ncbi:creatininase family protein [Desulfofundulus thermocisternus]|uniref:creatininase family protein n=1 Tax=Desulfofundulus thermocisternus TaxID=42471 RepID=UPI00217D0F0E|nr:creatininase family protein [Desulfofundulus thermocisternus]MCS5697149.1 creatininase family protein [Desulfofundulus thermocisternus]
MDRFSTWEDLRGVRMAFLPVGSLEQHGPHLPLGTDGIIAEALAGRLADIFAPAYLLPLLPFSSSFEHAGFPGSVSLKVTTIASVISDVVESLAFSGIGKLVIVSCHMGNHLLRNVVQELNYPRPRVLLLPSRHHWEGAYRAAGLSSSPSRDMHAGEGETSIIMHLFPEAVRSRELKDVDRPERELLETLGMRAYTETGTIGFPSRASANKGAMLLSALAEETAKTVKEFVEIG